MTIRAWINDLAGCAFVATLATAALVAGACALAHPILTTTLIVLSGWYIHYRKHTPRTS